jgi:hypothetical protein
LFCQLYTCKNILNLTEHFQFRPCHFFLPCLVNFALNYVSVFIDISKKNGFGNKTTPIMERSWSTSEIHVHCRTACSVVNCWIRYNNLCCRLCKIVCLSKQGCQAFMYFRGLYISWGKKPGHSPYKVPFLFYET